MAWTAAAELTLDLELTGSDKELTQTGTRRSLLLGRQQDLDILGELGRGNDERFCPVAKWTRWKEVAMKELLLQESWQAVVFVAGLAIEGDEKEMEEVLELARKLIRSAILTSRENGKLLPLFIATRGAAMESGGPNMKASVLLGLATAAQLQEPEHLSIRCIDLQLCLEAAVPAENLLQMLNGQRRLLEKLNSRTIGPPLFLVPGYDLEVQGFQALASLLPIPAYGISWPSMSCERWLSSLDELADLLVKEVLLFQSSGHYWIVSQDAGAAVCIKAARLLEARGKEVPLLVLLDPMRLLRLPGPAGQSGVEAPFGGRVVWLRASEIDGESDGGIAERLAAWCSDRIVEPNVLAVALRLCHLLVEV